MQFQVLILGANSALPSSGRFPSSQVVYLDNQPYLIDCGEGAQIKMSEFKVRRSKIRQIFISHLHGDHIYGLPGLIGSFNLLGRSEKLSIYSPEGLEDIIHTILDRSHQLLHFNLEFHTIDPEVFQPVFRDERVEVFSIPLRHRIPTCGYLFSEKKQALNIDPDAIEKYNLSIEQIKEAKTGKSILLESGKSISADQLTLPPKPLRSYAYCSDTLYDSSYLKYIQTADVLYHEATYLHKLHKKAADRMHATAHEAALAAKEAGVKKLILGHYSSRYKDLQALLEEARRVFPNTELAEEGKRFEIA